MEAEEHYNKICKFQFEAIHNTAKETNKTVKDISERLFIDNGRKSLQSRVNDNSRMVKWMMGIFAGLLLLMAGAVISHYIFLD